MTERPRREIRGADADAHEIHADAAVGMDEALDHAFTLVCRQQAQIVTRAVLKRTPEPEHALVGSCVIHLDDPFAGRLTATETKLWLWSQPRWTMPTGSRSNSR